MAGVRVVDELADVLTGLTLSRADYLALVQACEAFSPLPSWAAWNKLQIRAAGRALKRGEWPEPTRLDLDAFLDWCARRAVPPGLAALQAYAAARGEAA